jgi:hypothetical protein
LALKVSLGEECSGLSMPAVLELYDRAGNLIARASVTLTTGQTITFGVGPNNTMVQNALGADAYLVLPPETHLIQPCIKVYFPPGPCRPPTDLLTPTMETLDATNGRLMSFANNPHTLVN